MALPPEQERTPGSVAWFFPASYLVHLLEELFGGSGFTAWVASALRIRLSDAEFLAWNAVGLTLMCAGAMLVRSHPRFRAVELAMSIAVLGNAAAHAIASLVTWTYSPGLVTGALIWIPFGLARLRATRRASSPGARVAGFWIGVSAILVMVAVLALHLE